jgi:hypothetical protein
VRETEKGKENIDDLGNVISLASNGWSDIAK